MSRSLRSLLAVLTFAATVASAQPAAAESSAAGTPKFVLRMGPEFNHFVESPTPAFVSWMNQNFWRTEVFSPYFDNKTSWYPHGLVYRDLYAIYTGGSEAAEHPEWILRNAAGEPMYIPYGCSGTSCPQYAADVGDPSFRHAWIAEARAEMERGYAGLWIDDVNLEFRVGNGAGEQVAPIDPHTGRAMTETAWREYIDTFLEEIRQALPHAELLENSIWFAGGPERWKNPLVQRQIATADYINLERGVNDGGLTGGNGEWSLKTFLSFVDYVHSAGKGVILDGQSNTPSGREYSLAAYYLISTGNDGIGNGAMTPENWWSPYNYDLGAPEGPRREWEGLLRRDYTDGIALVNEPGAPTRTVSLPAPMYNTEGAVVTSVTLGAANGAVLRYVEPPGAAGGGEGAGSGKATGGKTSGGKTSDGKTSGGKTSGGKTSGGRTSKEPGSGEPARTVSLTERSEKHGEVVILAGHVDGGGSAEVRLSLDRLVGRGWLTSRTVIVQPGRAGRFLTRLEHLPPGRFQAQASMLAASTATESSATESSGMVGFAIPALDARAARIARRAARAARRLEAAREAARRRA
jgi:hypothetical protein